MNADHLQDFRDEGLDVERTANLREAEVCVRSWERSHPWSLDDFLAFLASLQEIFGPIPARDGTSADGDFRL